jgi:protocatechuate 3,4-dioxygenase beta subunit
MAPTLKHASAGSSRIALIGRSVTQGRRLFFIQASHSPKWGDGRKFVSRAALDFWHADTSGEYDNSGFRLRGHQFTDDQGRYRLETIVPGVYPGRTRHIHVKVHAPGTPILTSQLFFPGEVRNRSDWLFRPDLLVAVIDSSGTMRARFDFIVAAATDR